MWNNLKASIASVVRTNNNQEITGANLQNVLNTIVNAVGANATFAGIAVPSTNPGTPDGPVFYIACEPGVYSNFNLTLVDGLYVLENKTGSWVGTQINTGAAFEALIGYYNAVLNGASITVPDAITYRLTVGGDFKLKMLAPGTTATTLTIGNATDIPIWYNGAAVSAQNTWEANEIISVFYDGTRFMASNSQGGGGKAEKISYNNTESGIDATNVQEALDETVGKVYFEQIREISFAVTNRRVWNYTAARGPYTGEADGYIGSTSYINVANVNFVELMFQMTSSQAVHCFFTDNSGVMVGSKLYNTEQDYKRFKVPSGATRLYFCSNTGVFANYGIKFINRYAINEVIPEMKNVTDDLGESLTFGNASYCDFAISDENGNDILRLQNGHIRTKNFNSEDVETNKYTKLEGKHLVIIGDSISSYSGYSPSGWRTYYPQGEVNSPVKTYWYQLANALKMTYNNCAYSSSRVSGDSTITTTTGESGGCPGCSDLRMEATSRDGKTPDVILIYMGVNDWAQGAPIGNFDNDASIPAEGNLTNNFSGAYALMLKKLRTLYPLSRVFCCTIPSSTRRGDTPPFIGGDATIPLQTYNDTIVNVAHIMGCDVIDLAACGINYLSGGLVTVDCDSQGLNGLHPNILGHQLMFNKILTEIMAKY